MNKVYTWSEIEAAGLLMRAGVLPVNTGDPRDSHWAGDWIIQLAERIKAERATMAMEGAWQQ